MRIEDAWYFNIYNLRQGDEIGCPICKAYSGHKAWEETATAYDSCPGVLLYAIVCPKCARTFDYINDAQLSFKVRTPAE